MIIVENLSKSFKRHEAVQGLSFCVEPGEVLGLIGPNGAGKTTILRCLAGILRPDRGRVLIGGHDLRKSPVEAKQLLAFLPDQQSFFETLTSWEHARFVASVYGVEDFAPKAERLFKAFDLVEKRDTFAAELSRGQRQRLGLILAFLHRPQVLLLDEPMLGLDPRGIKSLNELILRSADEGSAIIMSSHLLSILQKSATKVLLLKGGTRQVYGPVEEVQHMTTSDALSLEELFFQATEPEGSRRLDV